MPTLILSDVLPYKDVIVALIGFLGGITVVIIPYLTQRKKLKADIHTSEMQSVNLGVSKILELMKVVELAHKKSLEDESKIKELEAKLRKYGH